MWDSESYTVAASLLPRLLGVIYFFAITPFLFQIIGLLGKTGILPVIDYLKYFRHRMPRQRFFYVPTLFWLNASDPALMGVIILGTVISVLLFLGLYPALCLACLFIIYLSIVSVGQDFLSYIWESFLLEITFYTFLVTLTPIPNAMTWINLNFLLFRFHIQVGAVKIQSRDPAWRDFSALAFHYQSQPLPNTWAWYVHQWPLLFHKTSTLFMFFVELMIPFGLFFMNDIRIFVGITLIVLQIIIWLTGNFAYLNHLTAAFCIIAFPDQFLSFFLATPDAAPPHWLIDNILTLIGSIFLVLQSLRLFFHFYPYHERLTFLLTLLSPFHLVNHYGLFAVMTKKRYEIVVEGSGDGIIWKEYLFRYKPSEVTRRPRRISPFQPRLDWQMWFLPFDDFESEIWFHQFLYHLLKGTPEVLKLVRENPFPQHPPTYLRAMIYDYQFSTKEQKKQKGWWWERNLIGRFSPILSLPKF